MKRAKRHSGELDPASQMKVENELGVLDDRDVEQTIEAHFDDVRSCYQRAGKAQRYAEGRVVLRFLVAGDGRSDDVLVVESNLGNYRVERCLVEVGRRIIFSAPSGGKATSFDYPIDFKSTNQMEVLDIDGLKIDHDVALFRPRLAACGRLAKGSVVAIMYIEPSGLPGSVGLAAASALDEDAGECVVQAIRHWRMSATLPGRVLRANFNIPPPVVASSTPLMMTTSASAEPRRAASSAGARRRHR